MSQTLGPTFLRVVQGLARASRFGKQEGRIAAEARKLIEPVEPFGTGGLVQFILRKADGFKVRVKFVASPSESMQRCAPGEENHPLLLARRSRPGGPLEIGQCQVKLLLLVVDLSTNQKRQDKTEIGSERNQLIEVAIRAFRITEEQA